MLDGLFNGTRTLGDRDLDLADMTEEEIEAELKKLMQTLRAPVRGKSFPKADLTAFNQFHEQMAQIFDPTGEHARAMEASGRRGRSRSSRRLRSYLALIQMCVHRITRLCHIRISYNLHCISNLALTNDSIFFALGRATALRS